MYNNIQLKHTPEDSNTVMDGNVQQNHMYPNWYGNHAVQQHYPMGYPHMMQGSSVPIPPNGQEDNQLWHHSVFNPHVEYFAAQQMHQQANGIGMNHHHFNNSQIENTTVIPSPASHGSDTSSNGENRASISPPGGSNLAASPRQHVNKSPYEWIRKTNYTTQPQPGKTRTKDKYRVVYTDNQRMELEKEFYYSRYITIRRKSELAQMLGLSERQVKIWFQNRRAKERKIVKKREETKHEIFAPTENVQQIFHL